MKITRSTSTKQHVLDVAVLMLLENGANALTLENVAHRCGISKGGLFHHYASKEKLMLDVAEHIARAFERATQSLMQSDPIAHGRSARAYVHTMLSGARNGIGDPRLVIGHNGVWVDHALVHVRQRADEALAVDHIEHAEPVGALAVRLAADGLWLSDHYRLYPISDGLRADLERYLVAMTLPERGI